MLSLPHVLHGYLTSKLPASSVQALASVCRAARKAVLDPAGLQVLAEVSLHSHKAPHQ